MDTECEQPENDGCDNSSCAVSALLVQSNSHDIGNEKSSEKFTFQFF